VPKSDTPAINTNGDEAVDYFLDDIEGQMSASSKERQERQAELNSIDQMLVESLVSRFYTASNQDAYLRALAMVIVRTVRSSTLGQGGTSGGF
jgi:hypothetical protein